MTLFGVVSSSCSRFFVLRGMKLLLIGLLCGFQSLQAMPSDRKAVAQLEAARVEIDEQTGISIYQGDVHFQQGSLNLWADKVTLYSRQGKVERLLAEGQPARLQQRLAGDEKDARAQATSIEYFLFDGKLILRGDAHMWRQDDEFLGDAITYDEVRDTVVAESDGDGRRVQVIIHPAGDASD